LFTPNVHATFSKVFSFGEEGIVRMPPLRGVPSGGPLCATGSGSISSHASPGVCWAEEPSCCDRPTPGQRWLSRFSSLFYKERRFRFRSNRLVNFPGRGRALAGHFGGQLLLASLYL